MVMSRNFQHYLLVALIALGLNAQANGQRTTVPNRNGIRTEIVVSDVTVLPFEPVSVLLLLRNDSKETSKLVASRYSIVEVGEATPQGPRWKVYEKFYDRFGAGPPSPPFEMALPPDYLSDFFFELNFHGSTGEHVFARPGSYKVKGSLGNADSLVSDAVDITVEQPVGVDAKGYQFLKTSPVRKVLSENQITYFPYTTRTTEASEKFIAAFGNSKYGNLARIGLALMWLKGVGDKQDLSKTTALLTHVTEKAQEPLVSRAYYYLGVAALAQQQEAKASEYFRKSLQGKPDRFFKYLGERALADDGFRKTRLLHQGLLKPQR